MNLTNNYTTSHSPPKKPYQEVETGEMAQGLKTIVFAEDLGSVLSTFKVT